MCWRYTVFVEICCRLLFLIEVFLSDWVVKIPCLLLDLFKLCFCSGWLIRQECYFYPTVIFAFWLLVFVELGENGWKKLVSKSYIAPFPFVGAFPAWDLRSSLGLSRSSSPGWSFSTYLGRWNQWISQVAVSIPLWNLRWLASIIYRHMNHFNSYVGCWTKRWQLYTQRAFWSSKGAKGIWQLIHQFVHVWLWEPAMTWRQDIHCFASGSVAIHPGLFFRQLVNILIGKRS